MGLFDAVRKSFNKPSPVHHTSESEQAERRPEEEPAPIVVPEIQPADLIPVYEAGNAPRMLDCREPYEWHQVHIPGSLHIPMNQIPARLAELDPTDEWIVVCAHGNRSFSVAGYLIHNGYRASSLAGGVTDWWMRGGKTERGVRR